ncbi:MAG: ferrochelatase [Thermaerobacter sp.]|nr:ferrochelatase [Thermaerobacter sp.]
MTEPRVRGPGPVGVLVMAHGVATGVDDIPRYYAHIRGERPKNPAVEQELVDRYQAIGGHSPLIEITAEVARGLEEELARRHGSGRYSVAFGFRHVAPYIGDALARLQATGAVRYIGLVQAPHYSAMSVGAYQRAASAGPLPGHTIGAWHLEPRLIRLLADRVRAAAARLPVPLADAAVAFTAHSLPERIRGTGDPYAVQVAETAAAVAAVLGLATYEIGWQSAGRTPEAWMGPDVLELLRAWARAGRRAALVAPVGFVSDHLEVLYDLDVEARALADSLGLAFVRTQSLNADPQYIRVLADVVGRDEQGKRDRPQRGASAGA